MFEIDFRKRGLQNQKIKDITRMQKNRTKKKWFKHNKENNKIYINKLLRESLTKKMIGRWKDDKIKILYLKKGVKN